MVSKYRQAINSYGEHSKNHCVSCYIVLTEEKCPKCGEKHGLPASQMPDVYCQVCFEIKVYPPPYKEIVKQI